MASSLREVFHPVRRVSFVVSDQPATGQPFLVLAIDFRAMSTTHGNWGHGRHTPAGDFMRSDSAEIELTEVIMPEHEIWALDNPAELAYQLKNKPMLSEHMCLAGLVTSSKLLLASCWARKKLMSVGRFGWG